VPPLYAEGLIVALSARVFGQRSASHSDDGDDGERTFAGVATGRNADGERFQGASELGGRALGPGDRVGGHGRAGRVEPVPTGARLSAVAPNLALPIRAGPAAGRGQRAAIVESRERLVVDLGPPDTPDGVRLLVSGPWSRGYRVKLNGNPLPVQSHRGLVPSVALPAGAQGRREIWYEPGSLRWAKWIAGAGLLTLALAYLLPESAFPCQRGRSAKSRH
jgi:hypothetical protein